MELYETHLHTSAVSACSNATPEEQVRAYKARGYTGFITTDHFFNGNCIRLPNNFSWRRRIDFFLEGYKRAKALGGKLDFDVFLGLEFNVSGSEFLTYGLTPEHLYKANNLDRYSVAEFSKFVRQSGGYLAQAHPFREAYWIPNPGPVAPHFIDAIEAFNADDKDQLANPKSLEFAKLHNLPIQAGSDSHHTDIPFVSGIGLPKRAKDIFDIINAIKNREVSLITN